MELIRKMDMEDNVYIPDLLCRLWKRKGIILLGALLGAMTAWAVSRYLLTPLYESSVTLYVNNTTGQEDKSYITQADLSASAYLVKTYSAIILSDSVMESVIEAAEADMEIDALVRSLEISSANGTEVFRVTIRHADPQMAARLVNTIAEIAPDRISDIVKGSSVEIIDRARVPSEIAWPDYALMVLGGFAAGMILAAGCLLVREILDTGIKTASDFSRWNYPLLVSVPDFFDKKQQVPCKKAGYQKFKTFRQIHKKPASQPFVFLLSKDTPFAVREAYKTLRTNVIFSSPDAEKKVIVVTSALQGECKSTTAINLAVTFAQNQAKVLLMDCDLRLPAIAKRMGLPQMPGLSELVMGMDAQDKASCAAKWGIHIMTSGTIPPNPTELLGSEKMKKLMTALLEHYDYIIMDTPPLEDMADAVILSRYASDVLLVVRQDTSTKADVDNALRKLELAKAKVLGFVFTGVTEHDRKSYGKHGYGYQYDRLGERGTKAGNVQEEAHGHR